MEMTQMVRTAAKKRRNKLWLMTMTLVLSGCSSDQDFKEKVLKVIKENPEVVVNTIKERPADFILAFQNALQSSREELAKQNLLEREKKVEAAIHNPLKAKIREDEAIRGPREAELTLVEYSDFECPYCTRGFETVNRLKKRYGDKLRVIYKHLPLSFHKSAMISAQYYEALRLQSHDLAFSFHDEIFKNQSQLRKGEKYLKQLSNKLGANMKKLEKDIHSLEVKARIADDMKEAAKFGFKGTPGFLINGVPVNGAFPDVHFVKIIDQIKKKKQSDLRKFSLHKSIRPTGLIQK